MKRFVLAHLLLAFVLLVFAIVVPAQSKVGPKDGADLKPSDLERIKPGDQAPDFTLEDQDGKLITLSEYRDKKSVVLVFYRGYW